MQSLLLGRRYFAWGGEKTDRPYIFRIFPMMGFAPYLVFTIKNKGLT